MPVYADSSSSPSLYGPDVSMGLGKKSQFVQWIDLGLVAGLFWGSPTWNYIGLLLKPKSVNYICCSPPKLWSGWTWADSRSPSWAAAVHTSEMASSLILAQILLHWDNLARTDPQRSKLVLLARTGLGCFRSPVWGSAGWATRTKYQVAGR